MGSLLSLLFLHFILLFYFILFYLFYFILFLVYPMAYGSSQARGRIGAAAASLHHSHNTVGSEWHLGPTSQLMTMPDL